MNNLHTTKLTTGFTLIELLVVIAIIGILSSVVLASLNTARGKGADAATKGDLNNIRAQAEIVYDNNASYAAVCADANVKKGISAAASAEGFTWATTADNNANYTCTNSSGAWMAYVQLAKTGGTVWWCVDNTGNAKGELAAPGVAATVCP